MSPDKVLSQSLLQMELMAVEQLLSNSILAEIEFTKGLILLRHIKCCHILITSLICGFGLLLSSRVVHDEIRAQSLGGFISALLCILFFSISFYPFLCENEKCQR